MSTESMIADAINNDSKKDRRLVYGILAVISIVSIVVGIVMWGLISTLAGNMQSMSDDMGEMKVSMKSMDSNMNVMVGSMMSMDKGIVTMANDMTAIKNSIVVMTDDVSSMNQNTNGMKKIMKDFNKMNPLR